MRSFYWSMVFAWVVATTTFAADPVISKTITAGKDDLRHVIVRIPIENVGDVLPESDVALSDGRKLPAELIPADMDAGSKKKLLTFVIPELKAGSSVTATADKWSLSKSRWNWDSPDGSSPKVKDSTTTFFEYVRPKFDPAATPPKSAAIANPTIKVYHHLWDATGTHRLTNGPEGQFPHHRGIYFGFNRISYDGKQADVWHCRNGESQQHVEFVRHTIGRTHFGHVVKVSWNGQDGKSFAIEEREVNVLAVKGGWLVEFNSLLTTDKAHVRLDGDPQHAGFHFRAAQDVEKNKGETYFLRPGGKGDKGKEVNWEPKGKTGPTNLPWNAMSFIVGGKRFTVVYLDHPDNPKEARQSERTYGRIGTYFEYDLKKDKPLRVKYRLLVVEGELTVAEAAASAKAFSDPPSVK